jgi:pimeloyl-ACP methyl ester carboxylesterase
MAESAEEAGNPLGLACTAARIDTSRRGYPVFAWCAWGVKAIDTQGQFPFGDMLGPWLLADVQQARGLYADQFFSLVEGLHASANGDPLTPTMSDMAAKGWQDDPVVKRWLDDTTVGHRQASGPILVVQGTADVLYIGLPRLKSQLRAAGDRFRTVVLSGASHDDALTEGWPAAKPFLRANWLTK